MYVFDTHQDIADSMLYSAHGDFWKKNRVDEGWNDLKLPVNNQSDFVRLQEGKIKAIFGVSCAIGVDPEGHIIPCPDHFHDTIQQIALYHRLKEESAGKVAFITKKEDLNQVQTIPLSILLTIEGADSIDQELENLQTFFDLGVRAIGLTWSYNNPLAGGCAELGELTDLGERTIRRMQELGILLDLSHINEKSYYQALAVSTKPVIVSHTAAKSIYNHERNIDDAQIKAVAQTGGAVGICGVPKFIGTEGAVNVNDVVRHLDRMVEVAGVDHVIIGSDFGAMTAKTLMSDFGQASDMPNLIMAMEQAGYSQGDIEKIAYKNINRILNETLPG